MAALYAQLGLQDVLFNPETKQIYTPNTNRTNFITGAIVAVLGGLGDIAAVGTLASELAAVATIGGWTGVKLCVAILLSSSAAVPIIAAGGGVF